MHLFFDFVAILRSLHALSNNCILSRACPNLRNDLQNENRQYFQRLFTTCIWRGYLLQVFVGFYFFYRSFSTSLYLHKCQPQLGIITSFVLEAIKCVLILQSYNTVTCTIHVIEKKSKRISFRHHHFTDYIWDYWGRSWDVWKIVQNIYHSSLL